jgi:hypothetical protein
VVEKLGWLTEQEYISILGVGQVLPGANTVNAAVMIGDRFQGPVGACVSVLALMAMPLAILIVLASLYAQFSALPDVRAALQGSAAAAGGFGYRHSGKDGDESSPEPRLAFLQSGRVGRHRMAPIATHPAVDRSRSA